MKPYLYSLIKFIKEEINVIPKESANTSICQNILHKVVFISISKSLDSNTKSFTSLTD